MRGHTHLPDPAAASEIERAGCPLGVGTSPGPAVPFTQLLLTFGRGTCSWRFHRRVSARLGRRRATALAGRRIRRMCGHPRGLPTGNTVMRTFSLSLSLFPRFLCGGKVSPKEAWVSKKVLQTRRMLAECLVHHVRRATHRTACERAWRGWGSPPFALSVHVCGTTVRRRVTIASRAAAASARRKKV